MTRIKQLFLSLISFSKTESNGAIVLLVLIVLCLAAPSCYKLIFGIEYAEYSEDERHLNKLVQMMEDLNPSMEEKPIELKLFNPNTATIQELNALGLPFFLSKRIDNYRIGGGQFKVKGDLSKIYDFPDSLYTVLKDFIDLPDTLDFKAQAGSSRNKSVTRNTAASHILKELRYNEPPLVIDINKADSLEFQRLYGIGPGYARRLVAFREALGGYYSVDQVGDMFGMTDSLFLQIKSFLHVSDTVTLQTININLATFKQLNAHPYISFELTKEILAAKSKYGKFKQPEDLGRLTLLDTTGRRKLLPYLKF